MRRVLLTGATGLLGTWIRRAAPADTSVVPLVHRTQLDAPGSVEADLRDRAAVEAAVAQARPALVIHAAYAHDEASIVDATRHVASAAAAAGADLVHISTDAVFSGDGARRDEVSAPDPIADYGRWKAKAEELVTEGSAPSAVVRLPLIVSLDPEDHVVARIRAGAADGQPTPWFDDEIRQPAAAEELAAALWQITGLGTRQRAGTWHLPGPESLSRYDIARRVVAALGLPHDSITAEPTPPSADRPRHLHLGNDRARRSIGWSPSPILS